MQNTTNTNYLATHPIADGETHAASFCPELWRRHASYRAECVGTQRHGKVNRPVRSIQPAGLLASRWMAESA